MTLGFGVALAIVHSGIGTLLGLIGLFTFLTAIYLDGPAKSVTVRDGTLKVRNSIHRYEIPPSRVLSYLVRWIRKKYRRLRPRRKARLMWERLITQHPRYFAHWAWARNPLMTARVARAE